MAYIRLMQYKQYNWQQTDWPSFRYDLGGFGDLLFALGKRSSHLSGVMRGMAEGDVAEATVDLLVSEAIKTSEIEGEYLSREDVRSSICVNLGYPSELTNVEDPRARGAGSLMVAVRKSFYEKLSEKTLFAWHTLLMEGANRNAIIGKWRLSEEPMQVVSGPIGKWKVHFEAPPSDAVKGEMKRFIAWFNATAPKAKKESTEQKARVGEITGQKTTKQEITEPGVRAAIAHLYFESIHPFDDGNGRIGRAIADKALAQEAGVPLLISLSRTISTRKSDYYEALTKAQRSKDVTEWVGYFLRTILKAHEEAEHQIDFVLKKSRYLDKFKPLLMERQMKVILRMFREGPDGIKGGGFEGGMNARKYWSLTKVSKATATRDLQRLEELGALVRSGHGRSTNYSLTL